MRFIALFCLIFFSLPARADVTVFAAASLRGALDEVNAGFQGDVTVSYASSAVLARQIAQGAPADLFLSANPDWVAYLQQDPYVDIVESAAILGNRLVLVGSETAQPALLQTLAEHLTGRSLAMGLTTAVPAGIYARQALASLGLWDRVAPHVVQTDNVRAALALVSLGEVDYALVYHTDALAEADVAVLDVVPEESHPPITYVAAQVASDKTASAYFLYLQSKAAQQIFARHGFVPRVSDVSGQGS